MAKKRSTESTAIVFALFCSRFFSTVFALFRSFSHFLGYLFLTVFWPSVFALFCTIRLLPFSGCHLDSSELSAHGEITINSLFLSNESFGVTYPHHTPMAKVRTENRSALHHLHIWLPYPCPTTTTTAHKQDLFTHTHTRMD